MIRGFVDSLRVNALNEGRVVGWACDTGEPAQRLQVRGRIGNRILGMAVADRSRPDLLAHGIGDGESGFVVMLEGHLSPDEQDRLVVEARRQDSGGEWLTLPERRVNGRRAIARHFQEEAASELWAAVPEPSGSEDRPVFVIGSPRSGTSAIFQSLTLVTRYRGFFEGHVLDVAAALGTAVSQHFRSKAEQVPNPGFYHLASVQESTALAAVQQTLLRLASGYQTRFWADKTPTPAMIRSVPLLAATWPGARFIFMKRRGIENVQSRLRKFRRTSFEYNAGDWAVTMAAWREVRETVRGRFIELEQMDLLRHPIQSANAVAELLTLDSEETSALGVHLSQNRPEVTDPTAHVFRSIEETGWDSDSISIFHRLCDQEMAAYGYTFDECYLEVSAGGEVTAEMQVPEDPVSKHHSGVSHGR